MSAGGTAVAATPAQAALLGGLLPNLGTIITQTGQTLGNLLPGVGGIVTGVTGTVGGVVGGVQTTVEGLVDQTLGGVLGGTGGVLPTRVVDNLLGTLLTNSAIAPGTPGLGGPKAGGPIVLSGGQLNSGGVVVDAAAPRSKITVLSGLRQVGATGKMRLEVGADEPGIVAVAGNVRPGDPVKQAKGKKPAKHSRGLIKIPRIVLAYRKAGKLVVTVHLSRAAQRTLRRSKNARITLGTIGVDVFRNQDSDSTRITIPR